MLFPSGCHCFSYFGETVVWIQAAVSQSEEAADPAQLLVPVLPWTARGRSTGTVLISKWFKSWATVV